MSEDLNTKSLGEKLFEARRSAEMTAIPRWSDLMDHEQEAHEKAALAFAASLSHDETANAVITDLRQRLEAETRQKRAYLDEIDRLRLRLHAPEQKA